MSQIKEENKKPPLSFDELYLRIAFQLSEKSIDPFTRVGCVAANERHEMIGGSYNGFKPKYAHSEGLLEDRERKNLLMYHAEQNIILRHPRESIDTLYITHSCCQNCAKLVAGHGIKNVIYCIEYHRETFFKDIFREYGVNWKQIPLS